MAGPLIICMVEYEIFLSNILLHIYINQFVDEKPKPTKQKLHFVRPIFFSFVFFCTFVGISNDSSMPFCVYLYTWISLNDLIAQIDSEFFYFFILFYNFEGKKTPLLSVFALASRGE